MKNNNMFIMICALFGFLLDIYLGVYFTFGRKMITQANEIANYCSETVLRLRDDNAALVVPVRQLVLDQEGKPLRTNELSSSLADLERTGIYAFVNEQGVYSYIGQGGARPSTPLKNRISQELRLYKKTANGNNGGTLSKNIQELGDVVFDDEGKFKEYVSGWSLRIVHLARFEVSIELIEAFAIELFKPSLNKAGRAEQVTQPLRGLVSANLVVSP